MKTVLDILNSIWSVALEAAPWLLFGLIAAGLIKAFVPQRWIVRAMGGNRLTAVFRASVVGIPLPLCSCGVLPTALGLRRQGASRSATSAFLVSTPEIGVDSIALSYALLGPFMAVVRPIAAFISAIATGLATAVVEGVASETAPADPSPAKSCCSSTPAPQSAKSCCAGEPAPQPTASCCADSEKQANAEASCCSTGKAPAAEEPMTAVGRLGDGLAYVFSRLLDDVKLWLGVAVVVAGLVFWYFPEPAAALETWGSGPLAKVAMLVVGIPLYVCATATTPIAAGLLAAGVSPGTVLVLLLAGPATNIGSIAILRKELGTPIVATYLATIAIVSLACGMATDALARFFDIQIAEEMAHVHHLLPEWLAWASALTIIGFAIVPLRRRLIGR